MLARTWAKGNPFALLAGMQTGAPMWKAVWRYLKKLKMNLPFDPVNPILRIYLKKPKTLVWKNINTPVFIAALFPVAGIWKQPKHPSVNEWMKQLWDIYTTEYYLAIKTEENCTLCNSMDRHRQHYAKWNKPVRERQIPYDFIHMWNLMNKLNYQAKWR